MNHIIENAQERIAKALVKLLRHHGVWKYDRYWGEFPYPNKDTGAPELRQCFAFGGAEARDAIAGTLQEAIGRHGWENMTVRKSDGAAEKQWPYNLELVVTGKGISSTIDAYLAMAAHLDIVGAEVPAHRGIPWAEFVRDYRTKPEMLWKAGADAQIAKIGALPAFYRDAELYVVGSHTSKSISLPVVQMELPRNGTLVTFRDNFHDICVSVDAKFPVQDKADFKRLFDVKSEDGFFEGFPEDLVHGSYQEDKKRFSFAVRGYPVFLAVLSEVFNQDAATDPRSLQKQAVKKTVQPKPRR